MAGSVPPTDSEYRAFACQTSSVVAASIVRWRSPAATPKRVGEAQENPAHLLGFLLLERDDVVVDLNGAERFEEQARAAPRAAVHDAGYCRAVFRTHHQHVPAVAIRDDLLLKVLRGVFPAQVRLQRSPQPRLLLAQPIPNAPQLGAGVVHDLAGRIDLPTDIREFALERRRRLRHGAQDRKRCAGAPNAGRRRLDRSEEGREREQRQRLQRPAFHCQVRQRRIEILWRSKRNLSGPPEKPHRLCRRRQRCGDGATVSLRLKPRKPARAWRRLCEAANRLDDPVEFEGLQSA